MRATPNGSGQRTGEEGHTDAILALSPISLHWNGYAGLSFFRSNSRGPKGARHESEKASRTGD
jgi:hypothetical protein